jgi:hypothetical protein
MSRYQNIFYRVYHWLAEIPPKISWGSGPAITSAQRDILAQVLASGYYVILTGSSHHLSSVIVSLLTWCKTGHWGRYSHVLMNCDNIENSEDRDLFKFVEATARGVAYATFDEVFACDRVCLLTPKTVSNAEWTRVIDALLDQIGRPYDDLFDLADATHVSCVEVVLAALAAADYAEDFANLAEMIKNQGNLVPEMYRDCVDFTVAVEF